MFKVLNMAQKVRNEKEKELFYVFKIQKNRKDDSVESRYIGYTYAKSPKQALNQMRFRLNDWSIQETQYFDDCIVYCEARRA